MQAIIEILAQDWASLIVPLGVLAATLVAGYLLRCALFELLQCWSAVPNSGLAGIAIDVLRGRFMFWALIAGLHLATRFAPLPGWSLEHIGPSLLALWVVSLIIPGARIAARAFRSRSCAFGHTWNWPRRREGVDTQVCSECGFERRSPVQFANVKP